MPTRRPRTFFPRLGTSRSSCAPSSWTSSFNLCQWELLRQVARAACPSRARLLGGLFGHVRGTVRAGLCYRCGEAVMMIPCLLLVAFMSMESGGCLFGAWGRLAVNLAAPGLRREAKYKLAPGLCESRVLMCSVCSAVLCICLPRLASCPRIRGPCFCVTACTRALPPYSQVSMPPR